MNKIRKFGSLDGLSEKPLRHKGKDSANEYGDVPEQSVQPNVLIGHE